MRKLSCLLPLLGVACIPSFDSIVSNYESETTLAFFDCGELQSNWNCEETIPEEEQCFAQKWEQCEAAKLTIVSSTIEGDPIYSALFVQPNSTSCTVQFFQDTREDKYHGDYPLSTHSECQTYTELTDTECVGYSTGTCSVVEVWE